MIKLKETNPTNKFLFFLIFTLLYIDCSAQEQEVTKQNKFVIGLRGYFDSIDENVENRLNEITNEIENTYFNIGPYIGWRLNNKWLLGIETNFYKEKSKETREPKDVELSSYSFGVFGRYERNLCKNLNLYIKNFLTIGSSNYSFNDTYFLTTMDYNSFAIGFSPGLVYSFNKRLNFLLGLGGISYVNSSRKGNTTHLDNDVLVDKLTGKRNTFTTNLNFARPVLSVEIKI